MSRIQNKHIAREAAQRYQINPRLFLRQMRQEADFRDATSPAGAQGPAQIMPATAASWGVRNVHDPREAYDAAAHAMSKYLKSYGGSWSKALTAYNAGPGRVGGALPAETQHYIETILGGNGEHVEKSGKSQLTGQLGDIEPGRRPRLQPGTTKIDTKGALTAAFLQGSNHGSLFDRLQYQIGTGNFTTQTGPTVVPGRGPHYRRGDQITVDPGGGRLGRIKQEAERIDDAQVPYLWGGGHQAKQKRGSKVTPLDCSGAVSRLLGINPRVAAQFAGFGKPGRGKRMTIYANSGHVLVEIDGHFWGTSRANPGGGAGWIPRSAISDSYLAGFTARHPAGL